MEAAGIEASSTEKSLAVNPRKRRKKRKDLSAIRKLQKDKAKRRKKLLEEHTAGKVQPKSGKGKFLNFLGVQDLFLCTLLDSPSIDVFPQWLRLPSLSNVHKAVVVLLSAVGKQLFEANMDCFSNITRLFEVSFPTRAGGSEDLVKLPHETLLTIQKSWKRRKSSKVNVNGLALPVDEGMEEEQKEGEEVVQEQDTSKVNGALPGREYYVLNGDQLSENSFPLPDDKGKSQKGYMKLGKCSERKRPVAESPLFAIDCEMCQTKSGKKLTRVSVVNETLELLYDSYVKPRGTITDYLTRYSGITAEILEGVTTTLMDVQEKLNSILPHDAILVGHSLEYDFRALKLHHDRVIDTSVIYNTRGVNAKPSLRKLVFKLLGKAIQQGDSGHSPVEDARACMELVLLKIEKGPLFGPLHSHELFDKLDHKGVEASLLDSPSIVKHHSSAKCHAVPCTSDEQVVSKIENQMKTSAFTWAHLHAAEHALKGRCNGDEETPDESIKGVLRQLDSHVGEIVGKVPTDCLVLVICGCEDISTVQALRKEGPSSREKLVEAVERTKSGICFVKRT